MRNPLFLTCALLAFVGAGARAAGPAEDEPPAPPAFRVPKGWQEQKAAPLASARFQILEGKRQASVVVLEGGGGLAANVNRWRGQLGLQALPDEDAETSLKPVKVDGVNGYRFDLTGADVPETGAVRIRAVIVARGERMWFFKMMGPANLVENQAPAFDGFVDSVRFKK
ncbi:MAG: hypothetical protein FJ304_25460 [Planctomycetes bacterium]|nr:hypothetical protein [Planctomycetota bacterium]